MRHLIFTVLFTCGVFASNAQLKSLPDSIHYFADSAFSLFEKHSLYGADVDWEVRKHTFLNQATKVHRFSEVMPLFQSIFDDLKDNHSFFWYNNQKYASNFGQLDESSIRKPLIDALENGDGIHTTSLIGNIGYIRIAQDNTSDDFNEMQKSAQHIQDMICEIYKPDIEGWIIDLRLNTGGNMYPMICGLSPFLKSGVFASTIDRDHQKNHWSLNDLGIYEGDKKITELQNKCLPNLTQSKVAILTSEITGSSGEITALAFLNRSNITFIGEKTAGYMTSNELFRLPFETFLLLTHAYETDSQGNIIKLIKPNINMIEGDNFSMLSEDKKVLVAIEWIKNGDIK